MEQMVPPSAGLGCRGDGMGSIDPRCGSAAKPVAVRALALVQTAARRPHHGRPDVRRDHFDGSGSKCASFSASFEPVTRSVRNDTDYQGHAELLQIHDPPLIEEL